MGFDNFDRKIILIFLKITHLPNPRIPLAPRAKHFIRKDSTGSWNLVCLAAFRINSRLPRFVIILSIREVEDEGERKTRVACQRRNSK